MATRLAQARDSALRRLGFLLGETAPPALEPGTLAVVPDIPAGLPADMLARRPDVTAAIARLEASDSRLHAARKSWLPSFALTASGGAASPSLGQLLASSARDFGLSALLSLPLFDGGRRKAAIAGRKAEVELAAAHYRESVLVSLREVNDRLGAVRALSTGLDLSRDRLAQSEENRRIAGNRTASGLSSRASILEAVQQTSGLRFEVLDAEKSRLCGMVDLIKALGGGW